MARGTAGAIVLSVLIGSLLAASKEACDIYAAIGQSLAMPFSSEGLTNADVLRWTHNSTIVFSRDQGRVSVGKAEDVTPLGALLLKGVKSSSAGVYQVQVRHSNGSLRKTWEGRLCMMDKVSKPQLTFACDFKANAVHLTCQVAKPEGLSFSWTLDEKPLAGETKQSLSVSLTQLKGDRSFTCSAANRVSKDKSDTARPKCTVPPPPPPVAVCFAPMTVAVALAVGGGLILILLTVVVALCCCRRRSRRRHEPGAMVGERGPVRMLSLKTQEAESCGPEYETMQPPEDSPPPIPAASTRACYENVSRPEGQAESRPSQPVAAADENKPSPVPKPRTKAPQTPNV